MSTPAQVDSPSSRGSSRTQPRALHPIDLIISEHRLCEQIFEKFLSARTMHKLQLGKQLCQTLTIHAMKEDLVLYPLVCLRVDRTGDSIIDDAEDDHFRVKNLIFQINECTEYNPQYEGLVKYMMNNVIEHVKKEEETMLPLLREQMNQNDIIITLKHMKLVDKIFTSYTSIMNEMKEKTSENNLDENNPIDLLKEDSLRIKRMINAILTQDFEDSQLIEQIDNIVRINCIYGAKMELIVLPMLSSKIANSQNMVTRVLRSNQVLRKYLFTLALSIIGSTQFEQNLQFCKQSIIEHINLMNEHFFPYVIRSLNTTRRNHLIELFDSLGSQLSISFQQDISHLQSMINSSTLKSEFADEVHWSETSNKKTRQMEQRKQEINEADSPSQSIDSSEGGRKKTRA